jgi:hypothetical protein
VSYNYSSLGEAARALLVATCTTLKKNNVHYVIAGGWVPLLRGARGTLTHPGTRDVDVLFDDDREAIGSAAQLLLDDGFILSAKHEFQLLKTFTVGGKPFVFNVDLMHPQESSKKPDMFHDIMDLGIRDDYNPGSLKLKSICFPSSAIIFEENLWSPLEVRATDSNGNDFRCDVPLMNEAALILSKSESVKQAKRMRDAFDIYFILAGPGGESVAIKLRQLSASFPQVSEQLRHLEAFLRDHPDKFDQNVQGYLPDHVISPGPSDYVRKLLFS